MLVERFLNKQLETLPQELRGSFRDVEAIKLLSKLERLVFTSTALLQQGEPFVSQYFAVQDQTLVTKQTVLQLAGSLAKPRRFPKQIALIKSAQEMGVSLREMETEEIVDGLTGKLDRTWYILGTELTMNQENIELGVSSQTLARQMENEGKQIIYLAQRQPKRLLAIFSIQTPTHPKGLEIIEELKKLGVEITVLTSQKTAIAKGILQPLSLELMHSELCEVEKTRAILSMYEQNPETWFFGTKEQQNLLPKGAAKILLSRRLNKDVEISLADLAELPHLIEFAKVAVKNAKRRYFWCRI